MPFAMTVNLVLIKDGHPPPVKSLVESIPVQEGEKLSAIGNILRNSWEEFQGLSWTIMDEF